MKRSISLEGSVILVSGLGPKDCKLDAAGSFDSMLIVVDFASTMSS